MQISWWTLGLQAINFLVLVWLLERFLYRPVKEVIARRTRLARQATEEAEAARRAAEAEKARYEEAMAMAEAERTKLREAAQAETEAERRKALEAARAEADAIRDRETDRLARERTEAMTALRGEVADLAVSIAGRVLGDVAPLTPPDATLAQLEAELDAQDAEMRDRLAAAASSGEAVEVVTATPLSKDQQKRWRAALASRLGGDPEIRFSSDPALIGGAVLRLPHAEMRASWADRLAAARAGLLEEPDGPAS